MNDRFKFRIWDKIHNRFLCIDNQKRIIFDYEDKQIRILEDEENACWLQIPFDECIILQCTGLKDKNGKLIYEGDIVKENISGMYKISYRKCAFYLENNETLCPIHELAKTFSEMKFEVIDNIYENAELLEE